VPLECERWQWRELLASERGPPDSCTRLVLFVLALHMNQTGQNAFPSQVTLARRSGLSERSVRKHLDIARKLGWIKIHNKPRKGKAWFVHEYVACVPDQLGELCDSKPWETNPIWTRPESRAGRRSTEIDLRQANGAGHSADRATRPANCTQRAASGAATPGTTFRDARHHVPTNTPSNSSMNTSLNAPLNTPCNVQSLGPTAQRAIRNIRKATRLARLAKNRIV
jgi:hypothetical protein